MAFHGKNLTVGILIGVVLGVVFGYAVTSVLSLASLSEQINGLQDEIDRFQIYINERNSDIAFLTAQISDKDDQISALQSQILSLEQQLGSSTGVLGVKFSPDGGCEDQVLFWIGRANVSIHVLIYSFTLDSIGDALIQAHGRGIEVQVVFEKGQISQYSEYQRLKSAGISVRNDTNSKDMHNKVMIIDGIIVLTGSFNYSDRGENDNNENLIAISSQYVGEIYEQEFTKIWDDSQPSNGNNGDDGSTVEAEVIIDFVHYDAEGDDWDNLNNEYVVIWNKDSSDAVLTGWKLKDEADHTYTFPSFTLGAGQKVTVYTGSGTNIQTSLYWGSGSPVWNNDHDTVYFYNQNTELIDTYSW